ncbi:methyltransferase family protein [Pseudoduganella sp. RAF53_2]|uniref:methyltransferase family protein n=1 Tax=unclassified Pseudoduganella TaxID=2637179 RepID=UPI003F96628D
MFWRYFPIAHAVVFGLLAVTLRSYLAGRMKLTFLHGQGPRDFVARCFYLGIPLVDIIYLVFYTATGNPGPLLLDNESLRWLGLLMMVLGPAWVVYAQASMGRSWAMGVVDDGELMTGGPFAISRHPIYLGVRIIMLGQLLVIGSWPVFVVWVLCEVLAQIQVRFEEEAMHARYGQRYAEYCARVRRWL